MSTETIPNEVLDRILHRTLTIPTATFEAWREQHTYATTPTSAASGGAILAVSKRWYDIGIPLLYESAIIRTLGQAEEFAQALHNPRLGPLKLGLRVRRLRIESGYSSLVKILQGAPGITDLFLGLNAVNADTIQGLQRVLKKTNPSRLFLDRLQWSQNLQFEHTLIKALAVALPEWTHLVRLSLFRGSKAPALEYVCLPASTATLNIDGDVLEVISRNPRVKTIHIPKASHRIVVSALQARTDRVPEKLYIGSGKEWVLMVPILGFPVNVIKENPGPLPDLPDKIWIHILGFATEGCAYNLRAFGGKDRLVPANEPINRTRRNILLVSKRFHVRAIFSGRISKYTDGHTRQRLGLPCMYSIPHFPSKSATRTITGFMARICASSELADVVHVLYCEELSEIVPVPVRLRNLVYASRRFRVFPTLVAQLLDNRGSSLQWMEQELTGAKSISPTVFLKLSQLQTMILHGGHTNDGDMGELADALPRLETLGLSTVDAALLDVFVSIKLPSLRSFSTEGANLPTPALTRFMRSHGAKLHVLSVPSNTDLPELLDLCPNIVELNLFDALPPSEIRFFKTCAPHTSIQRIVLPRHTLSAHYLRDRTSGDAWYDFIRFLAACRTQLPALTEVQVGTIVWPVVESEARKSMGIYVAWFLNAEAGLALAGSAGRRVRRFVPVPQSVKKSKPSSTERDVGHNLESSLSPLSTPQDRRLLVGIAGVPASGKSTLAHLIVERVNSSIAASPSNSPGDNVIGAPLSDKPIAAFIGLDGWHLTRARLDEFPDPKLAHDRRGAHWTFDGEEYVAFVRALREPIDPTTASGEQSQVVYAPSFSHEKKDPMFDAIPVYPHHRLVIIEGLYTFLSIPPWSAAAELLDERWYIDIGEDEAERRLVVRHVKTGVAKDLEEAVWRSRENDAPNGRFLRENMMTPTRTIPSIEDPRLSSV
ncbi:hypothetical protein TRAPUB_13551 [Trametes pubescens]|uniref:Uridine kinase n=1 Tax=Trametes pubescens TaxID=154538 RepID=A0A1M2VQZ1_TRAPU|nr:hypothetical protein TRAPUB_13551 [Trametes pubescens]